MQCHHHHHQQWWGVVQTTGWYQVKAVHLPAAERQIHNQTLVNEKHGHIQKPSSLLRLSFSVSFSMWYFCTFYYYCNTHTHLISLPLCTSCKYINWPFCYKETIFSVNMYMYLIDKVTKCHFLWNGDQCKVLLNRKVKNQSISKLWTTELSRAFLRLDNASADGGVLGGGQKVLNNINAVKPYSVLG